MNLITGAVKTIYLHYYPFVPISSYFVAPKEIHENNKVWSAFCFENIFTENKCLQTKCACLNNMPSLACRLYIKEASLGEASVSRKLSKRYASPGRACAHRRRCRRWKVPRWIQELRECVMAVSPSCWDTSLPPVQLQPAPILILSVLTSEDWTVLNSILSTLILLPFLSTQIYWSSPMIYFAVPHVGPKFSS